MSRIVEIRRKPRAGEAVFAAGPKTTEDRIKEYGERVAKYVPAEILAFYTTVVQATLTKEGPEHATFRIWVFAIAAVIALIATPIYIGMFSKHPKERRVNQIMATLALVVWVYAYPAGWFVERGWHDHVLAAAFLALWTLISGAYQPEE